MIQWRRTLLLMVVLLVSVALLRGATDLFSSDFTLTNTTDNTGNITLSAGEIKGTAVNITKFPATTNITSLNWTGIYGELQSNGIDGFNDSSLVGYWKLNNETYDHSGYGNDANEHNTYYTTDCVLGGGDCAIGGTIATNRYISVKETTGSTFNTGDFTISTWYNCNDSSDIYHSLIEKRDANDDGYRMWILKDSFSETLRCSNDLTDVDSSSTGLCDYSWHHYACVFDRDGNLQVFVDGSPENTVSINGDDMDINTNLTFGAYSYDPTSNANFGGIFDEITIYNRTLSATEVQKLYAMGLSKLNISYETNSSGVNYCPYHPPCDIDQNYVDNLTINVGFETTNGTIFTLQDYAPILYNISFYNITAAGGAADTSPTVTLIAPDNNTAYTADNDVTFACNVSDDMLLQNITIYTDTTGSWAANITNSSPVNNSNTTFYIPNIKNGTHNWNCYACDNASQCSWGANNWTINVSVQVPIEDANVTSLTLSTASCTTSSPFNLTAGFNCVGKTNCSVDYYLDSTSTSCSIYAGDANQTALEVVNGTSYNITNVQLLCSVSTDYDIYFNVTNAGDAMQYTNTSVTCSAGAGGLTADESYCILHGTYVNGTDCAIGLAFTEEDTMDLTMVVALMSVSFLFMYFAFNIKENEHFLLKLLLIFFSLATAMIAPGTIIAGYEDTAPRFIYVLYGFFVLFITYFSVYLFYHWAKKSEKFMNFFGSFKRR
jgi:hypothetical protein